MRIKTVSERQLISIGGKDSWLTEADADALARMAHRLPPRTLTWEHRSIRVGPFCGVIRAGDLTIEILPKIAAGGTGQTEARGVLIAMLRTSGGLAAVATGTASLGLQKLHLLDVFILDFCGRVSARLRHGAVRSYHVFEDELPIVRGRLRLADQLRRSAAGQSTLHCRFDELTIDNPHNRQLRAILVRLLGHAIGSEAKGAVNSLLLRMAEVVSVPCTATDLTRLQFNRLTDGWRPVFEQAILLLRGLYPDVQAGQSDGSCLVSDMERLFEAYVGVKLRDAWRDLANQSLRIILQGPQKYLAASADGAATFRMRPDASLVSGDGQLERIFDTKWKQLDPNAANLGIASGDAYQLASYAARYECERVALIYPWSDGFVSGFVGAFDIQLPGRPRIEVYALDLGALATGSQLPDTLRPLPAN